MSRAYFRAEAPRPVLVRLLAEVTKNDAGEVGMLKKSMYDTRDAASNWECDWQNQLKRWDYTLVQSSMNLFHHAGNRTSGMTLGEDVVVTDREPQSIEEGLWSETGDVSAHVFVFVKEIGLENANTLQNKRRSHVAMFVLQLGSEIEEACQVLNRVSGGKCPEASDNILRLRLE